MANGQLYNRIGTVSGEMANGQLYNRIGTVLVAAFGAGQDTHWENDINSIDKSNNVLNNFEMCRGGEIGRHVGFKIP